MHEHPPMSVGDALTPWAGTTSLGCASEGQSVHWGDFRVLKRGLVKRWEDITKLETCLHSLWSKRANLEATLGEAEGQLAGVDRALPSLKTAIDDLKRDIDEAEDKLKEVRSAVVHRDRDTDVDSILAAARRYKH